MTKLGKSKRICLGTTLEKLIIADKHSLKQLHPDDVELRALLVIGKDEMLSNSKSKTEH